MQPGVANRRRMVIAAGLWACYAANLWLTNLLRAEAGGLDTIWTANAFVIGAILLLPARWAAGCLAAGFATQAVVILLFGHPLFDAVGFSLLNLVEAVAVVALARRLNVVRLTTPERVFRLIFLALAPVLVVTSMLLGLAVLALNGAFPTEMLLSRLPAKFLGMSLVLPVILLIGREGRGVKLFPRSWEAVAGSMAVAALAALIFSPASAVALLALFPAMTVMGLRTGPRAVGCGMALICAVLFSLGVHQGAPTVMDADVSMSRQVTLAQVYLAAVFATGIITALMAVHQQRLRAILARGAVRERRARVRAEAASVAKTEFLATMSHEIRTPLNAIIGFAQVLDLKPDLAEDTRRQVGLIGRSGVALLTVVNDILDFSKVEAGRLELDPKPVDLVAVCADALSIVAESAERKGLTLDMQVEGDLAPAYVCDDHRLCQVLLNLLNNAVKFTDAGRVGLTVSARAAGDADIIRISVTDTGVGIAPDALATLFQRFSQVDSSVSRSHGGTGLGLAISKGLMAAMNGEIAARSVVGEGSTFWLEAPMTRAACAVHGEAAKPGGGEVSAHILLVDDHPMNRELGQAVLTLLGCTVDLACDGLEAVAAAQTRAYDAILMDVHMPGLDGLAATRAIRALGGSVGATPVIAMSADVLPEQIARMRAAGMIDSVEKPIDIERLHACLSRWVGRDASGSVIAA